MSKMIFITTLKAIKQTIKKVTINLEAIKQQNIP